MSKSSSVTFMTAALIGLSLVSCGQFTSDTVYLQATSLQTGGFHTCATLIDSTFKCWGFNDSGQLGQGDTVNRGEAPKQMGNTLRNIDVGSKLKVALFAVGGWHTCALLNDFTVKCWGDNSSGQLGLGDTDNRGDAPNEMGDNLPPVDLGTDADGKALQAVAISAGLSHTCVLLHDQAADLILVKCWGDNSSGQLGLGDTDNRGDAPNEMGDNLPAVDLGADAKGDPLQAEAIVAGAYHTCALLHDQAADQDLVKCWGDNSDGQLGQGNTIDYGDGSAMAGMGNNLQPIDLGMGRTARQIAAGQFDTCAVLDDGTAKCWGDNLSGQLGQDQLAPMASLGDSPGQMGDNLPVISLGTGRTALVVSVNGDPVNDRAAACAELDDQTMKCWGDNSTGQLGQGNTATMPNIGNLPGEMGDNLPPIDLGGSSTAIDIGSAFYHTCVLLSNQRMKCWGLNDVGELGLGDTVDRGGAPGQMGDDLPKINIGTT